MMIAELKELKDKLTRSTEVEMIPLKRIVVAEEDEEIRNINIQSLAQSIEARGLLHPVSLEKSDDGTFRIVCGRRRVMAYRYLNRDEIPAYVYEALSELDRIIIILEENYEREEMTPADLINHISKIHKHLLAAHKKKYTSDEILKKLLEHHNISRSVYFKVKKVLDLSEKGSLSGDILSSVGLNHLSVEKTHQLANLAESAEAGEITPDELLQDIDIRESKIEESEETEKNKQETGEAKEVKQDYYGLCDEVRDYFQKMTKYDLNNYDNLVIEMFAKIPHDKQRLLLHDFAVDDKYMITTPSGARRSILQVLKPKDIQRACSVDMNKSLDVLTPNEAYAVMRNACLARYFTSAKQWCMSEVVLKTFEIIEKIKTEEKSVASIYDRIDALFTIITVSLETVAELVKGLATEQMYIPDETISRLQEISSILQSKEMNSFRAEISSKIREGVVNEDQVKKWILKNEIQDEAIQKIGKLLGEKNFEEAFKRCIITIDNPYLKNILMNVEIEDALLILFSIFRFWAKQIPFCSKVKVKRKYVTRLLQFIMACSSELRRIDKDEVAEVEKQVT